MSDERQTIVDIKSKLNSRTLHSEVFTVTPKVAEFLLNLNWPQNRPLMNSTVERYAAAIKHGHWKLNGESLIMSNEGHMIDGQHRLYAVVEADVPMRTMITFGVDETAFDTINCGRARSIHYLAKLSPATAAPINFLLKLAYGATESTAQNLQTMSKVYQTDVEALVKLQSRNMPVLRQAPIVAAGVLWAKAGQAAYVTDLYANLLHLDSGSLPNIGKSFLHQCVEASTGAARKLVGTDLFVRAFKTFDFTQANVKRLQYKDGAQTIEQARAMIEKDMKNAGITLDAVRVQPSQGVRKAVLGKEPKRKQASKKATK